MDDKQKQKFKDVLNWIYESNEFVYSKKISTQKLYEWLENDKILELSGDELKVFFKDIDKFKYLKHLYNQLSEANIGKFEGIAGLFSNGGNEKLRSTIGFLNKLTSYLNDENILKIQKIGEDTEQKYKLISDSGLMSKKVYDYAFKELNGDHILTAKCKSSITLDFKDLEQATNFFSHINNNPEKFPNVKLVIKNGKNNSIEYSEEALNTYLETNSKPKTKAVEITKKDVGQAKDGNQLGFFQGF